MENNLNNDVSAFIITKPEIKEPILTMAFVNMQPITEIYSPEDALKNGTLFKNIDKPFYGRYANC